MGVWIETNPVFLAISGIAVTPCVGVWIETAKVVLQNTDGMSHPAWVCGLKRTITQQLATSHRVTPCVGVWIETLLI